jgi:hypothetical protein
MPKQNCCAIFGRDCGRRTREFPGRQARLHGDFLSSRHQTPKNRAACVDDGTPFHGRQHAI